MTETIWGNSPTHIHVAYAHAYTQLCVSRGFRRGVRGVRGSNDLAMSQFCFTGISDIYLRPDLNIEGFATIYEWQITTTT